MTRILFRASMTPDQNISLEEMLQKDRTGTNIGNLVYQYSVWRTLKTPNTEIVADGYSLNDSDERADRINNKFDAYVIPLADAFRPDFRKALKKYTSLIRKLKIPVYVIGVGARLDYDPDFTKKFEFDEETVEFVRAVVNSSGKPLGLRGELTGRYLKKLGFYEGVDYVVTGDPAMYTFGNHIEIRDFNMNGKLLSLNASPFQSDDTWRIANELSFGFDSRYFVPQEYRELYLMYNGTRGEFKTNSKHYPNLATSDMIINGEIRYFLSAQKWFDYMKDVDFSFGTRLHGNIVGTINGAPTLTVTNSSRVRELTEFHDLPRIKMSDIKPDTHFENMIEKIDFKSPEKVHQNNFYHYVDFLDKLGLDHIYKTDRNLKFAPADELLNGIRFEKPVESFAEISTKELGNRLSNRFS